MTLGGRGKGNPDFHPTENMTPRSLRVSASKSSNVTVWKETRTSPLS